MARRNENGVVNWVPTQMAAGSDVKPWHGCSNEINAKDSVETIMQKAGADFEVAVSPISYKVGKETVKTDDRKVLHRTDNGNLFDIVGSKYKPIQNKDVFGFFREFIKRGDMKIRTAGVFDNGKRVWCLAETGNGFTLGKGEDVRQYALFSQAHILGEAAQVNFTNVTPVCWNTFRAAKADAAHRVRITHFREYDKNIEKMVKEKLGLAETEIKAYQKEVKLLVATKVSLEDAGRLLSDTLGKPGTPIELQSRPIIQMVSLFDGRMMGANLKHRAGTAYGLLNAVTEYYDHHAGFGEGPEANSVRLNRAWFGPTDIAKRKIHAVLLDYAQAAA